MSSRLASCSTRGRTVFTSRAWTHGLQQVAGDDQVDENFYGEEELGGERWFTTVYPDIAVAEACVNCHNRHPDTTRSNLAVGDVPGGVVLRILMAD